MIEGVLLTGGASSRMGADKATLRIAGETFAERAIQTLRQRCEKLTILGPEPIDGVPNIPDREPRAGPLSALAAFHPSAELVFVLACDMPRFGAEVIDLLAGEIKGADAAIPFADDLHHPICALYRDSSFEHARLAVAEGHRSMMAWLDRIDFVKVEVDSALLVNANTPTDLEGLKP